MVQYKKTKELDLLFSALSDSTRRDIVLSLSKNNRAVSEIADHYSMSLTGVRKHITVLESSGLVDVQKQGRTQFCRLKPKRLRLIVNQIKIYESFWSKQIDAFTKKLEK